MNNTNKYITAALMIFCSVVWINLSAQQDYNILLIKAFHHSKQSNYDSTLYYYNEALELAEESNDHLMIAYINKLKGSEYIYAGQYDTALNMLEKSLLIADKLKSDTLQASNNINIGYVMFLQGKTDSAEILFERSLKTYKTIHDSVGIAKAYNMLTILYKSTGDYEKGIESALKSNYLFKKLSKTNYYIHSLINLGNIYEKFGEYDTAYSCYQICHDLSLKYNSPSQALTALMNMGVIDFNKGIDAEAKGDKVNANQFYIKSKERYLEAIEISKRYNNEQSLALCYSNMSNLSRIFQNHQEAIDYSKESLALARELDDMTQQINALTNLGVSYTKIENYQEAASYFLESLELSRQSKYKQEQKESLDYLSYISEMKGDYKNALEYQKKASVLQDSIFNEVKQREIEKHKTDFEILHLQDQNQLKELDKKRIRAERNTTFGIGVSVVIVLLVLLIFLRMRSRKNQIIAAQKIQKLEDEKKLMAARSVLVGQEKERERIAQELHDGIGVLLSTASIHFSSVEGKANEETSKMLKKANMLLKEAGKEVRQISHNMMPGVLSKFGLQEAIEDLFEDVDSTGNIEVNLQLTCGDVRLAENMEIMIFRIVQEMLNNTLKHAKASKISLFISRDNDEIFMDYTDDGIGFDEEKLPHGKNLGLSGIRSRVEYLGGSIQLTNSQGKGTKYAIVIPLSEKIT